LASLAALTITGSLLQRVTIAFGTYKSAEF